MAKKKFPLEWVLAFATVPVIIIAFALFVIYQMFNSFNARRERGTVFTRYSFTNRILWLSLTAVIALQILVTQWGPAQGLFDTTGLTLQQWGICFAVATTVIWAEEARKLVVGLFGSKSGSPDDSFGGASSSSAGPSIRSSTCSTVAATRR